MAKPTSPRLPVAPPPDTPSFRHGEKSQMYIQRYASRLPAAGETVIFDRSWYNRADVERVMGFCAKEQTKRFLQVIPAVEPAMVGSGIMLLKYWLEVRSGADAAIADAHQRRAQDREAIADGPEVVQPMV
jgi:polyphosphate kinase 2 (PPK2 family)